MVTSAEGVAEFQHQFDVRVAFPERIHQLLEVPTPTDPFKGLFDPRNFAANGRDGFQIYLNQQMREGIISTGLYYLMTHFGMELFRTTHSLGGVSLEPPLSHVSVSAKSDGQRFSSLALVRMDGSYLAQGQSTIPLAEYLLEEQFKLDKRDNGLVILGEDGNPEFEIARSGMQDGSMLIEDGLDIEFGGRDLATAHTLSTPEDTQALMERHALVIATVVNAIYEGSNQPSPDKTFFLWA